MIPNTTKTITAAPQQASSDWGGLHWDFLSHFFHMAFEPNTAYRLMCLLHAWQCNAAHLSGFGDKVDKDFVRLTCLMLMIKHDLSQAWCWSSSMTVPYRHAWWHKYIHIDMAPIYMYKKKPKSITYESTQPMSWLGVESIPRPKTLAITGIVLRTETTRILISGVKVMILTARVLSIIRTLFSVP